MTFGAFKAKLFAKLDRISKPIESDNKSLELRVLLLAAGLSALTQVLDPISVQNAFERAGIFGNTLTSDDPRVAIRPSVLLKRCPGVTDLDAPVSPLRRKSLESTVLNDTPTRKIVLFFLFFYYDIHLFWDKHVLNRYILCSCMLFFS